MLQITKLVKHYGGLRPLRIQLLEIEPGERVALAGLDAPAAEQLVQLITGASLPDEGEVRIFGKRTGDIATGSEWLASLDRFGIVTPRAVVMEQFTLAQNLAMPFTLEVEPVSPDIASRVHALAREAGLDVELLATPAGALPADALVRLHLARALALDPQLLLLEHITAALPRDTVRAVGADLARIATARQLALLAISEDEELARAVATRRLAVKPASGEVLPVRAGWWR